MHNFLKCPYFVLPVCLQSGCRFVHLSTINFLICFIRFLNMINECEFVKTTSDRLLNPYMFWTFVEYLVCAVIGL